MSSSATAVGMGVLVSTSASTTRFTTRSTPVPTSTTALAELVHHCPGHVFIIISVITLLCACCLLVSSAYIEAKEYICTHMRLVGEVVRTAAYFASLCALCALAAHVVVVDFVCGCTLYAHSAVSRQWQLGDTSCAGRHLGLCRCGQCAGWKPKQCHRHEKCSGVDTNTYTADDTEHKMQRGSRVLGHKEHPHTHVNLWTILGCEYAASRR
jgi:hypothetical protein